MKPIVRKTTDVFFRSRLTQQHRIARPEQQAIIVADDAEQDDDKEDVPPPPEGLPPPDGLSDDDDDEEDADGEGEGTVVSTARNVREWCLLQRPPARTASGNLTRHAKTLDGTTCRRV